MLNQQNLQCTIRTKNSPHKRIEAMVELMEYKHRERFKYWFGVLQMDRSDAKGISREEHAMIDFSDGRSGLACIFWVAPSAVNGEYVAPFVGTTTLS